MRLTYDEIMTRCRAYVAKVESGEIQRAQWEHFCAFCYEDPDELEQIIADYREEMQRQRREARKKPPAPPKPKGRPRKHPKPEDAQTADDAAKAADPAEKGNEDKGKDADCGAVDAKRMECGAELVRLSNYIQAQLATSPYWGGAQSQKAIFLLKQNRTGRGMREKVEQEVNGDVAIKVSFGGGLDDPFG